MVSTFPKIWGVTIIWINTQFWSNSRGTFDKNNLATIAYTFVGVCTNWIVTFSMPWGVTINWNMSSNRHQRVTTYFYDISKYCTCQKSTSSRPVPSKTSVSPWSPLEGIAVTAFCHPLRLRSVGTGSLRHGRNAIVAKIIKVSITSNLAITH